MKLLVLSLSLLYVNLVFTQEAVAKIPKSIQKSIPELSKYLTRNCSTTEEKVTAIYTWITENIAYDYDLLQSPEHHVGLDPKKILKKKKALSFGYAELMKSMLDELDIKSENIPGYFHNIHWEPGTRVVTGNHSWVCINIDGEWTLCDPTWDAGYIGRLLNKPSDYVPKVYKKNTFSSAKKEAKVAKKREKKEVSLRKKYDEKPMYKDKIGFVRDPQKEYFLIHTDTFLLDHLPIMPMWQFRGNPISVEEFSTFEDTLKDIIDNDETNSISYSSEIDSYLEQNYIDQMIITAEVGSKFNPYDPSIKLIYYYNYMALVHNKNLQQIARGSQYEITESNYSDLNAKTDTIIKYSKLFKAFEKTNYKNVKTFDKEEYKKSLARDKENGKTVQKVVSEYDKLMENVDKNSKKLNQNLDKTSTSLGKIKADYRDAIDYKEPEEFNKSVINKYLDSVQTKISFIDQRTQEIKELHDSSNFNSLFKDINYLKYLYERNEVFIRFNNYSTTEVIGKIDSLIKITSLSFLNTNTQHIPHEFLENELMIALKSIDDQCKLAKSELKQLESSGQLKYSFKYELYLQAIYHDMLKKVSQSIALSENFNVQIEKALKQFKGNVKAIEKMSDKQKDLKEDKFNFIVKQSELDHERSENLAEEIEKTTKKWKEKYYRKR